MRRLSLAAVVLAAASAPLSAADLELVSVTKIWDRAPHNAFTDLIRHEGQFLCVFREGAKHVSPDGAMRVIASKDGEAWDSVAVITSKTGDLRDAKICVKPDGTLSLWGQRWIPAGRDSFIRDDGKRRLGFARDANRRIIAVSAGSWRVADRIP